MSSSAVIGFGLTREVLEKTRARIQTILWLVLFACSLSFTIRVYRALRFVELREVETVGITYIGVAGLVAIAGIISTRIKSDSLFFALKYGIFLEVTVGFIVSIGNTYYTGIKFGHVPFLTWTTPLIIIFPLIVPTPPRFTLALSSVTALSAPLAVFVASSLGAIEATGRTYLESLISPSIAVAVAHFGSNVVHGLNLDYARAKRLGVYALQTMLGQGGMGQVWIAQHQLLSRAAAIKLISPQRLGREEGAKSLFLRFEQEAQATAQLRSPHTIEVYDFGVADDGSFYYVMELLYGLNLQLFVSRFGPQPQARAVYLLRQLALSLFEAHENGLIHRDIKPANIHLCQYGLQSDFVKVLDFGLVKSIELDAGGEGIDTAQHAFQGTPGYMSPEQILAEGPVSQASDIYAFGCVAYWLLTGQRVFDAPNSVELMAKHLSSDPVPVDQVARHKVSAPFAQLIMGCLEKEEKLRPSGMAEILAALETEELSRGWDATLAAEWWNDELPEIYAQRKIRLMNSSRPPAERAKAS